MTSYEMMLGDGSGLGAAIWDPIYGLHPLVGAGLGAGGQQLIAAVLKRTDPTLAEGATADTPPPALLRFADEIAAGAMVAVGGLMTLSPKTKGAGIAAMVGSAAAALPGIVMKYVNKAAWTAATGTEAADRVARVKMARGLLISGGVPENRILQMVPLAAPAAGAAGLGGVAYERIGAGGNMGRTLNLRGPGNPQLSAGPGLPPAVDSVSRSFGTSVIRG